MANRVRGMGKRCCQATGDCILQASLWWLVRCFTDTATSWILERPPMKMLRLAGAEGFVLPRFRGRKNTATDAIFG
jgi:hypothetical protein